MNHDRRAKKNVWIQLGILAIFCLLLSSKYYEGVVNCLNTTVMAFSYKYGLISRGFMGTILRVLNLLTPGYNLVSYQGIVYFSMLENCVYLVLLFVFFYLCLQKTKGKYNVQIFAMIMIFSTFAFTEYLTVQNFGRSDICMVMLTLIGVYLIIYEKWEWLIVPIAAIAVAIHQGYVLMFFNVLLVLLFSKFIDREGKEKRKYGIIFVMAFVIASVLFLYFNFFSHDNGESIFQEIYDTAGTLAYDGVVQYNVIYHEILGVSPAADEWSDHVYNFIEFPVFTILLLPYLVIAFRFFKRCIREAQGKYKLKYIAIAVGAATILPDMIIKIDYGRWMYSIIFYYFITILTLLSMHDEIIEHQLEVTTNELKRKPALIMFLLVYPVLFTPLRDTDICDFSSHITRTLFHIAPRVY